MSCTKLLVNVQSSAQSASPSIDRAQARRVVSLSGLSLSHEAGEPVQAHQTNAPQGQRSVSNVRYRAAERQHPPTRKNLRKFGRQVDLQLRGLQIQISHRLSEKPAFVHDTRPVDQIPHQGRKILRKMPDLRKIVVEKQPAASLDALLERYRRKKVPVRGPGMHGLFFDTRGSEVTFCSCAQAARRVSG